MKSIFALVFVYLALISLTAVLAAPLDTIRGQYKDVNRIRGSKRRFGAEVNHIKGTYHKRDDSYPPPYGNPPATGSGTPPPTTPPTGDGTTPPSSPPSGDAVTSPPPSTGSPSGPPSTGSPSGPPSTGPPSSPPSRF